MGVSSLGCRVFPANASAVRPVQTRGLRLVITYMETPRPLSVFFGECAGTLWGDSGEVTRIYTSRDIGPKNSPRVHLQSTTGATTVAAAGATTVAAAGATTVKGPRSRTPSCGFGDRCVAITLDPNVVHLSPRLIYRCIYSCWL